MSQEISIHTPLILHTAHISSHAPKKYSETIHSPLPNTFQHGSTTKCEKSATCKLTSSFSAAAAREGGLLLSPPAAAEREAAAPLVSPVLAASREATLLAASRATAVSGGTPLVLPAVAALFGSVDAAFLASSGVGAATAAEAEREPAPLPSPGDAAALRAFLESSPDDRDDPLRPRPNNNDRPLPLLPLAYEAKIEKKASQAFYQVDDIYAIYLRVRILY